MSASDISGPMNVSSSSSNLTSIQSMEEKKTKSHGGAAGSASALAGPAQATSNMMTEHNVQRLPTDRPIAVGTSQVSIRSSADRISDFNEARAVWEAAEAKLAYVRAQKALSAGSQTGSVGRRLDDVRSDTGSSGGPSQPKREQARDSPFAGIYSPPRSPTTTPTPTIYQAFSDQTGTNILDQILPREASALAGSHPPSGIGPSALAGALPDGGPTHGMISALAGSYRAVKHDRHGTPVPERAYSAASASLHPGAVASALAGHGTGGGKFCASVARRARFRASSSLVIGRSHR
jgi:hypothetical protein